MTTMDKAAIFEHAAEVLRENDHGAYTVPTKGLYPFQWNWDSCLTALGLAQIDERRAWQEIETLMDNQWEDGMVPHIVFHQLDDGYFPGPDVWETNRDVPRIHALISRLSDGAHSFYVEFVFYPRAHSFNLGSKL